MGLLQRTINGTRFYKPVPAMLRERESERYLMLAQKRLDALNRDAPAWFDFIASDAVPVIMTRRVAEKSTGSRGGLGPYQITYNFSSAIRNNKFPLAVNPSSKSAMRNYGASGFSFRVLYEFLCETFNGGIPFIDTYFGQLFKTRPVYADFTTIWNDIQEEVAEEQMRLFSGGQPRDKKGRFTSFNVWRNPIVKQNCKRVADDIRSDIHRCLADGRLRLRREEKPVISKESQAVRAKLGNMAHPNRLFYASGQLIRHLNIFVEIGDRAA